MNTYGTHTIDQMIKILSDYKKLLGGDTKIYLSDFEYNGKQTQFEVA